MKRSISRNLFMALCALCLITLTSGCASMLTESWSENYALASKGAKASLPEINDGKLNTLGVTFQPKREFDIVLPEEKQISRILIYSGNVLFYELYCWNSNMGKWVPVGSISGRTGKQNVYSDKYKLNITRFDHRLNFKTDKLKLVVVKAAKDGMTTTRTPAKNDRIVNQRTEYIQIGRDRVRVDLYDVFTYGEATIREIEVYSHAPKAETK